MEYWEYKEPHYVEGICAICGEKDDKCIEFDGIVDHYTVCSFCTDKITAIRMYNVILEDDARYRDAVNSYKKCDQNRRDEINKKKWRYEMTNDEISTQNMKIIGDD